MYATCTINNAKGIRGVEGRWFYNTRVGVDGVGTGGGLVTFVLAMSSVTLVIVYLNLKVIGTYTKKSKDR